MNRSVETFSEEQARETDQIAVGVVATGENDDAVARAVMRARARDFHVFLTYSSETRPDIFEVITESGTSIIESHREEPDDPAQAKERLAAAAQAVGHSGLVYLGEALSPVDYEELHIDYEKESFSIISNPQKSSASCSRLVAIPAYNEEKAIATVIDEVRPHADEIVVIDDGSRDDTLSEAKNAGATVVAHEYNRGYGAALQTAFETAAERNTECLVIIDGDGQHDTNDIPTIAEQVTEDNANVAIGSRFMGNQTTEIPLYRRFGLQVINTLTNLSMGSVSPRNWVRDTQSGFRAYDRRSIELLAESDEIGNDMDASLDVLYQVAEADCVIDEVGTTIDYDVENASTHHPVRHGLTLVRTILRTVEEKHPVLMLGVPGFFITLSGLSSGYLTMTSYIETNTVPIGLALTSAFLILLGVFACFTAIILHSIIIQMK